MVQKYEWGRPAHEGFRPARIRPLPLFRDARSDLGIDSLRMDFNSGRAAFAASAKRFAWRGPRQDLVEKRARHFGIARTDATAVAVLGLKHLAYFEGRIAVSLAWKVAWIPVGSGLRFIVDGSEQRQHQSPIRRLGGDSTHLRRALEAKAFADPIAKPRPVDARGLNPAPVALRCCRNGSTAIRGRYAPHLRSNRLRSD
jgi:hypothetical protein